MRRLHLMTLLKRVVVVLLIALCTSLLKSLPNVLRMSLKSVDQEDGGQKGNARNTEAWTRLDSILTDGRMPLTSLDYVLTSLRTDLPRPQGSVSDMPRDTYYLIEPKLDPLTFDHSTLLVFVQSSPERFSDRQRIRETWGNLRNYRASSHIVPIQVIFAMGLPPDIYSPGVSSSLDGVLLEDSLVHDILLLNILDTYNSLAYKGLLTMLWIANKSPRINYIFKTDDDVLLNAYAWINLIHVLEHYSVTCTIVGHVWTKPEVLRQGKYKEMLTEYAYDLYPSFCSGAGYLMSRVTMISVLEASFHLPIMKRDDPFYAGIIPRQTNVRLLSIPLSSYSLSFGINRNLTMFAHAPPADEWHKAWKSFRLLYFSGVRLTVTLTDETDRNTSLPSGWTLPNDVTLRRQCKPTRRFKAFIVKL